MPNNGYSEIGFGQLETYTGMRQNRSKPLAQTLVTKKNILF